MALYFVGLGVANIKDISIRGLELIKESDLIFLENYTNLFESSKEEIEKIINKKIKILSRKELEEEYEKILELAKNKKVCILVFGEPFFATTHVFLRNEALKRKIEVKIAHSSCSLCSIFSFGISCYKIGKIVTIPLKSKISDYPKSIYEFIKQNKNKKLHTILLLDIDVEKKEFLKPKDALNFLIEMEREFKENVINENDLVAIISKIGYNEEKLFFGKIKDLIEREIEIPAIIVLLAELSKIEKESLEVLSEKI